jgi:hypothetical protein
MQNLTPRLPSLKGLRADTPSIPRPFLPNGEEGERF